MAYLLLVAHGDQAEYASIEIDDDVPQFADLEQYAEFYSNQAASMEDALYNSLPGGTYDRLLGLMLQRKATHFRVSHKLPEERSPEAEVPQFERGDQIAYVPTHARGDIYHYDVEFGFVTSQRGETVFCRYWHWRKPGLLRTMANSETTPIDALVHHESVAQSLVEDVLGWIEEPSDASPT